MQKPVILIFCRLLIVSLLFAGRVEASPQQEAQGISLDLPSAQAFGRRPAISGVSISADGQHIVAVTSPQGERTTVTIWQADDLRAAPYVFGSDPRSEIISTSFIKNDLLLVTTQHLSDYNILGQAQKSYAYRTQVVDLNGRPIKVGLRFEGLNRTQQDMVGIGNLVSSLPQDPQHVLVSSPVNGDLYRLNLYSGRSERIERGADGIVHNVTDLRGEVRARQEYDFDHGAIFLAQWIKDAEGRWNIHFKDYARDRRHNALIAFTRDPNIVLISSDKGHDRSVVYEYNVSNKEFGDVVFSHPVFDVKGVVQSSSPETYGEVLGFVYDADRRRVFWTEPQIAQAYNQVREAMQIRDVTVDWIDIETKTPVRIQVVEGEDLDLISYSSAYDRMIFVRSGGAFPPEYYVLIEGRVNLLGRAYPELQGAPFGAVSLIQYEARDGLTIPAILTKPDPALHGPGPYPTIISPHGGPWERDYLDWNPTGWTQYFAMRGYAVFQPQFRGSSGWGQRLWRAGDQEWGRKMQDDKDDGVRYLIAQGIAAPDRVAMHGYSYGGYAAMMAAIRPHGLYQCGVSGAGSASIDLFKKSTYADRYLREFQHPTALGEDPLRRVNEVSIPLYLYAGDRDTQVIPQESRAMAAALERAGKPVKLTLLPDMEHTLNTWSPANVAQVLTNVEDYLKTECGPGGL